MNSKLYLGTTIIDGEEHRGYVARFGITHVQTLSQMEYVFSSLLIAQREAKYGGIANMILNAGGLLVDVGQANAKDTRDFFGDPL